MKSLLPLLCLAASACVSPAPVSEVTVLRDHSTVATGTAALLRTEDSRSLWITNAHVIRDADPRAVAVGSLLVSDVALATGVASLSGLSASIDAAVLTTDAVDAAPFPERTGRWEPQPGEPVRVHTLHGVLDAVMRPATGGYSFVVQGEENVAPGDSGAPVTDSEGRIVGLVMSYTTGRERVAWMTPLWAIRRALGRDFR